MTRGTVQVRLFGSLHTLRRERGLPTTLSVEVPESGMTGEELAHALDLPLELIEGVFRNHVVQSTLRPVYPGDQVAFVPQGTPGPHRFFLGLYRAGQEAAHAGEKSE